MDITLERLAYVIWNDLNGGVGGSNERIPLDQVKFEIHLMRGRLIAEEAKTATVLDNALYSSLNGIKLEKADLSQSQVETRKMVLHASIPKLLSVGGRHFVQYVTSVDKQTHYRVRFGMENTYWMHAPFTAKQPTVIIQDTDIWAYNVKSEYLSLRAVLDNLGELESEDGFECSEGGIKKGQRYPITATMADQITGKILDGKARIAQRLRPDPTNTQTDKN